MIDITCLSYTEIDAWIQAYSNYVTEAFDNPDKIASGWCPVCFDEFSESEEGLNSVRELMEPYNEIYDENNVNAASLENAVNSIIESYPNTLDLLAGD